MEYPISFNVMEDVGADKRHLVVNGLMSTFEKIWEDMWSARMAYILNKFGVAEAGEPISRLHGRIFDVETPSGGLKIVPLYHPAVAIYNQQLKPILIEDFRVIKTLI